MSKVFTVDDVEEIQNPRWMMGVDDVWCLVKFKGGENFVQFCATGAIGEGDEFSQDMYTRLKAGEFGELEHGFPPPYKGRPPFQEEVAEIQIAKRNQLLLESDFSDLPATQARFSDAEKTAWAEYRQALRDLTLHPVFPWDPEWPVKP